jgi:hypothetical protein
LRTRHPDPPSWRAALGGMAARKESARAVVRVCASRTNANVLCQAAAELNG